MCAFRPAFFQYAIIFYGAVQLAGEWVPENSAKTAETIVRTICFN